MKTPPFLMAGALLFWGWENHHLPWAAGMAAVLEASRWTRARWDLSNTDLNRICDLCWALLMAVALLVYKMHEDRSAFMFEMAQWLPVCFLPIMLAQAYGNRAALPLSVFSWLLRRSPASPTALKSYNISFCYFAVCLLAASAAAANLSNDFFYVGVTLLVALALTSRRPRRVSTMVWIMLVSAVAVGGQFGHQQLHQLQETVERALGPMFAFLFRSQQTDDLERATRIGLPGPIPLSDRIALRIRPEPGGFVPSLLREASWDTWDSPRGTWSASNAVAASISLGNGDSVKLLPNDPLSSEVEISRYYDSGRGLLPLPHGTFEIDDLPATLKTNRLGAVIMTDGPGLVDYRASFGPNRSMDSPPTDRDLTVDKEEEPDLAKVAANLKLQRMTDRQKIRAIERFFATNFTYSLVAPRHHEGKQTWLGYFLTKSHSGHCEYFATATVLLLREVGINARYVTGFAVPDNARHGDTFLVRERHSHAWALAYHTDTRTWEQVDTTPSDWSNMEKSQLPWWESASDTLSNLYFQFSKWRWSKTSYARYASWLLVPLIFYLLGRILFSRRRQRRAAAAEDAARPPAWPGLDSELYLINRQLEAAQLSRLPNEPLRSWQERLELAFPDAARLRRIFHLHRSLRFDPHGLKQDERETLRNESRQWLAEFTARMQEKKPAAR